MDHRSLSRRDFLRLGTLAAAGAALAACAPQVVKETVEVEVEKVVTEIVEVEAPPPEEVVLRLQNWFTETDMWVWNIGLDRARAMYPYLDFNLEFMNYDETAVSVVAAAAAGNAPDVIMAAVEHMPLMICQSLLLDLNPYIERDGDVDTDDFGKGVSQGFNQWGSWWGFPYDQSTIGVLYNKNMFDEAGVDYPPAEEPYWTYDDLIEAALALTKPDGEQWGVWWTTGYMEQHHIYSNGGRMFSDDRRSCAINSPEAAEGIQAIVDLYHEYKVAPTLAEQGTADIDYFCSGLVAMQIGGQWELQPKNQNCEFPFDVGVMPWLSVQRTCTGGSGFALSSSTEHQEEAWNFLKLFTSSEVLADMVGKTGRGLPARLSAVWAYLESGGGRADHPNAFVDALDWTFLDYSVVGFYEFMDAFTRYREPIYATGEGDVAEALALIEEETNAAMDEKYNACTLPSWGEGG